MNQLDSKKIAIIGLGGVGGYLGALLASAYSQVSFVIRGERKQAIDRNGLILHSDFSGERQTFPMQTTESAQELSVQDYVFICVKQYSLEEVCASLGSCIDSHTIVIPVMNGVDPGERVRSYFPDACVLDSLIYIVSFANPDFSITQQGNFATLYLGSELSSPQMQNAVNEVCHLLHDAGVDCRSAKDIQAEIWKKYILNCAYNVETAFYNNTIGQLRDDPHKAAQYESLITEAFWVARAKGIRIKEEEKDAIIYRFYHELADNATSSLQRDILSGKQTELETFSGYLVREAKRLGVSAPVSELMYTGLKRISRI